METYIWLRITQTICARPGMKMTNIGVIECKFDDKEQLNEYLIDRYGRIPHGKNKIYVDPIIKTEPPILVGFTHSYWVTDEFSRKAKKYFQTDWIECTEETLVRKPFLPQHDGNKTISN